MPKKAPKSGFYYFMLEYKRREENQGRNFPNGLRDVQSDPKCSEAWNVCKKKKKKFQTKKLYTSTKILGYDPIELLLRIRDEIDRKIFNNIFILFIIEELLLISLLYSFRHCLLMRKMIIIVLERKREKNNSSSQVWENLWNFFKEKNACTWNMKQI